MMKKKLFTLILLLAAVGGGGFACFHYFSAIDGGSNSPAPRWETIYEGELLEEFASRVGAPCDKIARANPPIPADCQWRSPATQGLWVP
jgi:hypothetical protein